MIGRSLNDPSQEDRTRRQYLNRRQQHLIEEKGVKIECDEVSSGEDPGLQAVRSPPADTARTVYNLDTAPHSLAPVAS